MRSKKVSSNLLKQNVYVRDCTPDLVSDLKSNSPATYESLDEVLTPDGTIKTEFKTMDYHITPDFVKSFSDSCDYRADPSGAIARSSPRTNLGDITDFQKVSSMDMTQARELYSQLSKVFANAGTDVSRETKANEASVENKTDGEVNK